MSSEKTEQPTPKRLRDARLKGDVPKSQEVPAAANVLLLSLFFIFMSAQFVTELLALMQSALQYAAALPFEQAFRLIAGMTLIALIRISAPMVILVIVVSLLSNLIQVGVLIAPQSAMPKLENLSPTKWFKQVFSKKNLFDFIKNLLKVVILCAAVYIAVSNHMRELFMLPQAKQTSAVWQLAGLTLKDLALYSSISFAFLAAIDLIYTRFKYTKDHMMTPDEVKREYKDQEGDPLIKSKRRQLQQEMAQEERLTKTRQAQAVIVNPTHYAVAIAYDRNLQALPKVNAKGRDYQAKAMIKAAEEAEVPVVSNPPLARAVYARCAVDSSIPNDLLPAVAEVLRAVKKLQAKHG